ncbi:glycerate kinase type-2 family protein [Natrinema longum]|uniref:Glycerate kinase n=1 Tax=Natrinema longum TaxID=370324 RepID=A0A8A2UD93_9EURY|nr:glycerate kinase [Natrinema longum]MBZ6495411.1 glycerate kinase [Natrinema longum]QSW86617.1 glycerate kinase [Natrinema longum]
MIEDRDRLASSEARELALDCLETGIEAGHPRTVVREAVALEGDALRVGDAAYDRREYEEIVVLGGGNAGAHVAVALEEILGDRIDRGVVVTDDPVETDRVTVREGDHPVPSERGVDATRELLETADAVDEDTLVLAAITGGGSALMPAPAGGVSLADLQSTTDGLLASGADIHEINAVRKHLSALKGGQLARRLAPGTVASLVLSDVVGNDPSVIASGPVAPDESTFEDALAVLERYRIDAPDAVVDRLERGTAGEIAETPSPDDPAFDTVSNHVVADGMTVLEAARETAADRGYETLVLSSRVRGEAREAATTHVAVAEEALATGTPISPPAVILSGGETTVTVRGDGAGGPNQEFATSAALALENGGRITVAAVDTDGIDGATDAAGALVDGATVADPDDARVALAENDVYPYLASRDALLLTGPTGTNLNDLRVLVVR